MWQRECFWKESGMHAVMNRQFRAMIEAEPIAIGLILIIGGRRKLP
jgi:hypothetical protein